MYGDYSASVSADGFVTATESLAFRSNHKNFTVTLESATETGTVSVTCQDSESNLLERAKVFITNTDTPQSQSDVLYGGVTDENGVAQMYNLDEQMQPTSIAEIPFGSYYIIASSSDESLNYTGALTVDGNEDVTITLTEQ